MDMQTAAEKLNGRQYRDEEMPDLFKQMREARLVAVFGASDDLMEFRGAIYDEIGAWNGTTAHLDSSGLIVNECDEGDNCPNFNGRTSNAVTVEARWCPDDAAGAPSWDYKTTIPHVTFDIMEDDELYCRGIVFSLNHLNN